MASPVIGLLSGYFSEELVEERADMRASLHNGGAAGVQAVKDEFRDLLDRRTMTHDDFWRATSAWFDDDATMYRELEDAYRFFFGEEPPRPGSR